MDNRNNFDRKQNAYESIWMAKQKDKLSKVQGTSNSVFYQTSLIYPVPY